MFRLGRLTNFTLVFISLMHHVKAGVITCDQYGVCQTRNDGTCLAACTAGLMACAAGAGLVAVATAGVGGVIAPVGCIAAHGACTVCCAATADEESYAFADSLEEYVVTE